ncbi:hypothetical protein [Thalassorhabdomicrobium marinisediminis]|uniref:hypothetical protein n=1 Tax=Thalassorhabdomicrobium marinisediminis TaxID=2170577 RepID=UPI002492F69A|nr:hypothetical protein [Thalassorhabdomicrobium marinisediminis]
MTDDTSPTTDNFARIYPSYLECMTQLLIALREVCDSDLDKALIMAVIGDRHFARRVSDEAPTLANLGATEVRPGPSVNTLSVAQYTEIPRETVRRKVNALVETGWVSSDPKGNLAPTQAAAEALKDGTHATIRFIERMSKVTGS